MIPLILLVELQFLFSAHRLIMVCTCTKFGEDILNGLRVRADMISILIITKGLHSVNIVSGVTVLVLCTSSDHEYLYARKLNPIYVLLFD